MENHNSEYYHQKIIEMVQKIENESILRYFYIFISEKLKRR